MLSKKSNLIIHSCGLKKAHPALLISAAGPNKCLVDHPGAVWKDSLVSIVMSEVRGESFNTSRRL